MQIICIYKSPTGGVNEKVLATQLNDSTWFVVVTVSIGVKGPSALSEYPIENDPQFVEFFSGKYNHDKLFSAQEALNIIENIEIVSNLPSEIMNLIKF